ncbi:protein FAF-like, chloroplastic [Dorcoceras hygrometricum]|uniref:Protein FAF-like, chloroplastic n=1 Tax=Dorcoceras hygrometricum TaxID=472368 RepID=A0A2Z7AF98_9LAMI|nr:protein FAF-like, chloroplastic [Dorcoceras hygrometricum]
MFLPTTSNASNSTLPNSALLQGLKWVAIERAKLGKSNATENFKNRGWNRREIKEERYHLFFVKTSSNNQMRHSRENIPKRHRSNLLKRRRIASPAGNTYRLQIDQKLVTNLFKQTPAAGYAKSIKTTTHQLIQTTPHSIRQHRYHQLVTQSQHISHNDFLAAGTRRNTQNATFQLIETTSLYLLDWFFEPAADLSSSRASADLVVNTQNVD